MSSAGQSRLETARDFIAAIEERDASGLGPLLAGDVVLMDRNAVVQGRDAVLAWCARPCARGAAAVKIRALEEADGSIIARLGVVGADGVGREIVHVIEFDDTGRIYGVTVSRRVRAPPARAGSRRSCGSRSG